MTWKRVFPIAVIALALFLPAAVPGSPAAPGREIRSPLPAGRIVPTTTFVAGDPDVDAFDQPAQRALVENLASNIITDGPFKGAAAIPNTMAPSLLTTREVVRAYQAMQGNVPGRDAVVAWTWSRWNATAGHFTDEYSAGFDIVASDFLLVQSTLYSPVVATGAAVDLLHALGEPVPQDVKDAFVSWLSACHDAGIGGYGGSPGAPPTMIDTAWAVVALGVAGVAPHPHVQEYIEGLLDLEWGLFCNYHATLAAPKMHLSYPSMTATRMAVETLVRLGTFPSSPALIREGVLARRDPTTGWFSEGQYYSQRVAGATAAAIAILDRIGYPSGGRDAMVMGAVDAYQREQLFSGGWAAFRGNSVVRACHVATIVSIMAHATPAFLSKVNVANLKSTFHACMIVNPATNAAAWAPAPAFQPAFRDVHALVFLAWSTGIDHVLNAQEIAAYFGSSFEFNVHPLFYPGTMATPFTGTMDWRTRDVRGHAQGARRASMKAMLDLPFAIHERNALLLAVGESQVSGTGTGLDGLLLATHHLVILLLMAPWQAIMAASLESTRAALEVLSILEVDPGDVLDVPLLQARIRSDYRETGTKAWFTREHPASFQVLEGGSYSSRLLSTRLSLDILAMAGATLWTGVNVSKIVSMVLSTPWRTASDVDNALVILDRLGIPDSEATTRKALQAIARLSIPGTGWLAREGMPSFHDTVAGFRVLSRFTSARLAVDGVLDMESSMLAIPAGGSISLHGMVVNAFSGPVASSVYQYRVLAGDGTVVASGTGGVAPVEISIALHESMLGPGFIDIVAPAASIGVNVSIPVTVMASLVLDNLSLTTPVIARGREPVPVMVSGWITAPGDGSGGPRAPVTSATIVATALESGHAVHFAPRSETEPGTYFTTMPPSPLRSRTTYHVEAAREYCFPTSGIMIVEATDAVDGIPAFLVPLILASVPMTAGVYWHMLRHSRLAFGTVPRKRDATRLQHPPGGAS